MKAFAYGATVVAIVFNAFLFAECQRRGVTIASLRESVTALKDSSAELRAANARLVAADAELKLADQQLKESCDKLAAAQKRLMYESAKLLGVCDPSRDRKTASGQSDTQYTEGTAAMPLRPACGARTP